MSQGVSNLYLILSVFVIGILVVVDSQNGYEKLEVEYRPMPPELAIEMENKTTFELHMEECMADLITCMSHLPKDFKQAKVCGESKNLEWKTFNNLCEMMYEKCKGYGDWHFLKDGNCDDTREKISKAPY